jgi:hypothetical protein
LKFYATIITDLGLTVLDLLEVVLLASYIQDNNKLSRRSVFSIMDLDLIMLDFLKVVSLASYIQD